MRFSTDPTASPGGLPAAAVLGWAEIAPAWAVAVERLPLHAGPAAGAGCGCVACAPRNAVADALRRLFLRQMRGEVPAFAWVLVQRPLDEATALADPFAAARFRREA